MLTVRHNGRTVDAVSQRRARFLFVFDRSPSRRWPIEERPVPASQCPRASWHSASSKAPRVRPSEYEADDVHPYSDGEERSREDRVSRCADAGLFTRPGSKKRCLYLARAVDRLVTTRCESRNGSRVPHHAGLPTIYTLASTIRLRREGEFRQAALQPTAARRSTRPAVSRVMARTEQARRPDHRRWREIDVSTSRRFARSLLRAGPTCPPSGILMRRRSRRSHILVHSGLAAPKRSERSAKAGCRVGAHRRSVVRFRESLQPPWRSSVAEGVIPSHRLLQVWGLYPISRTDRSPVSRIVAYDLTRDLSNGACHWRRREGRCIGPQIQAFSWPSAKASSSRRRLCSSLPRPTSRGAPTTRKPAGSLDRTLPRVRRFALDVRGERSQFLLCCSSRINSGGVPSARNPPASPVVGLRLRRFFTALDAVGGSW